MYIHIPMYMRLESIRVWTSARGNKISFNMDRAKFTHTLYMYTSGIKTIIPWQMPCGSGKSDISVICTSIVAHIWSIYGYPTAWLCIQAIPRRYRGDTQTHIWDGTHVRITSNDAIPLGIIILHESRLHHRVEVPNTVHWIIFFEIKEIFEVNGLIHVHNCL